SYVEAVGVQAASAPNARTEDKVSCPQPLRWAKGDRDSRPDSPKEKNFIMKCAHLILALLGMCLWPLAVRSADLAHIDRQIAKEPQYQHKPKYALAVFGPEAQFKVWFVSDGDVLYLDKKGNGDLAETGERLVSPKEGDQALQFKIGDIKVGDQVYKDLTVHIYKLSSQTFLADLPSYHKLMAADANALGYYIAVDVPTSLNLTDEK